MREESEMEYFVKHLEGPKRKKILWYEKPRLEKIICEFWGITPEDIYGKSRKKEIIQARHFFMYFLYDKQRVKNYSKLGNMFDKDHATVYYAVQKIISQVFTQRYIDMVGLYNELVKTIEQKTEEELNAL